MSDEQEQRAALLARARLNGWPTIRFDCPVPKPWIDHRIPGNRHHWPMHLAAYDGPHLAAVADALDRAGARQLRPVTAANG